jgi:hypothetical protein
VSGFSTESEMVAAWLGSFSQRCLADWTVYPETAGWDLLLAHKEGYQVGVEAKLSLNAKVLDQALSGNHSYWDTRGPDYRAVLVPSDKLQLHLSRIAKAIGIKVLTARVPERGVYYYPELPDEKSNFDAWPNWCPLERCQLPDYVPDVAAGNKSPVKLTLWKVKAIKLIVLLDRFGYVTRADMKALQISPTRWTDHWHGFLSSDGNGGYVRNSRTPDLRSQHPVNFGEIEADYAAWAKALPHRSGNLFGEGVAA